MADPILPLGKLPPDLLARVIAQFPQADPRVLLGPGIGLDCAVVDAGPNLLVYKSDPITFATAEIGWYAVQVNANDIATTGATPRWFLATLLLPEGKTSAAQVEEIGRQIAAACRETGVTLIGGHTEITNGLDHPILVGTMIGEVAREELITPQGAQPGDRVLVTKSVPVEATAILAREFPDRLRQVLSPEELEQARAYLVDPGIGVLRDAQVARRSGRVSAMHDPTEGGIRTALWELAEASRCSLVVDPPAIPVTDLSRRICQALGIDPLGSIASGALLLTAPAGEAARICQGLELAGIPCTDIGEVKAGPADVFYQEGGQLKKLSRPSRDEIARLYE